MRQNYKYVADRLAYEHELGWYDYEDVLGDFGIEVPTEYPYEKAFANEFAKLFLP